MIDRIHGGNCSKEGIIDFSVNTNPLGTPKWLGGIFSKDAGCILRYPDPSSERLKKKLSAAHSVGPENIAIGNGSIELIYIIPRALKIKKTLIITPTFSEYEFAVRANDAKCLYVKSAEKDNFKIDISGLIKRIPEAGMVFLCNPNNPTGAVLERREISPLLKACKKCNAVLVIDEAFMDFVTRKKKCSMAAGAAGTANLLVVRSLTKFFAIPGLRLGYAIGHKKIIEKITKLQYPWNVNGPAQRAGEKLLADKSYMYRTRRFIAGERQRMLERLGNIKGLKVYPPSANFILCKLQNTPIRSSKELTMQLLNNGIHIRDCGNFRGLDGRFFRVAVRDIGDNNRLMKCIEKAVR